MMLVVMDPHRLLVDMGLERSVIVRQGRKRVGHGVISMVLRMKSAVAVT
jgi:hypothetical protein